MPASSKRGTVRPGAVDSSILLAAGTANGVARGLAGAANASSWRAGEEITRSANLNRANARIKANKGAFGVDGISVSELLIWIKLNRDRLIVPLTDGRSGH